MWLLYIKKFSLIEKKKTLTLETRSEVRMAHSMNTYNIISFGIEQYGLKIGLHSSCNSVRLHTEAFQTQQNKVLEVWLTRFDPGVTRSSWIQASMRARWLRILIIHGNTQNPPNPLIRGLMAPPKTGLPRRSHSHCFRGCFTLCFCVFGGNYFFWDHFS